MLDLMGVMLSSYPSQAGQDSNAALRGYLMAIEDCSFAAVSQVLKAIIAGRQAGFENKFAPASGQLGEWCRRADDLMARASVVPKVREHGVLKLNFGGRDIDVSELTLAQVDEAMATSGRSLEKIGIAGATSLGSVMRNIEITPSNMKFNVGDEDAA